MLDFTVGAFVYDPSVIFFVGVITAFDVDRKIEENNSK